MKILLALPLLALPLAGCDPSRINAGISELTPAQKAALACLGATAGSAIAANSLKPSTAAAVASNGQVVCATATGVAAVVTK